MCLGLWPFWPLLTPPPSPNSFFTILTVASIADVVNRVRNGESIPYRPVLPETTELGKPLIELIKSCWIL